MEEGGRQGKKDGETERKSNIKHFEVEAKANGDWTIEQVFGEIREYHLNGNVNRSGVCERCEVKSSEW